MEAAPTPLQGSSATLHRAKAAASGMEAATVMPRVIVAQLSWSRKPGQVAKREFRP
jgi:hypothetical protein